MENVSRILTVFTFLCLIADNIAAVDDDIHEERFAHLRKLCNQEVKRRVKIPWNLLYSKKHSLACKLTSKIGSTFMIQLFTLLNSLANMDIFSQTRNEFHRGHSKIFQRQFTLSELEDYNVMIMGRNPYSRLYSAYVDKVYLAHSPVLVTNVYKYSNNKDDNSCMFNNSFQSFLNYALNPGHKYLFVHYQPLISNQTMIQICSIPHAIIVKQETFGIDVEYALNNSYVSKTIQAKVHKMLYQKNAEINVQSLSKALYIKMDEHFRVRRMSTSDCFGWNIVAERLWESLKIQGYIHEKSEFPKYKFTFEQQFKDVEYFIKIAINELRQHPLTSEEKLTQRNRYMLNAFRKISQETMQKIKIQYEQDFIMFQYEHELF